MSQGFEVDAPALREHARRVDEVGVAAGAPLQGGFAALQGDAFGLIGSFAAVALGGSHQALVALAQQFVRTIGATATSVRLMASTYEGSEADTAATMQAAGTPEPEWRRV